MLNETLIPVLRSALADAELLRKDAVLLVAVSGGADSVALLHALNRLQAEVGYALNACHIQHGLRGENSLADERFVRELCQRLDVALTVVHANLSGAMDAPGVETRARDCRRLLLAREMDNLRADALLLAHHRDDQTETVLMRLLRGAGANGLMGMRTIVPFAHGAAVRPFLSLPKSVLLNALEAEGLAHREDESNVQPCTPRNVLRLELLPRLEALFPGAAAHIAHTADALSTDEGCLSRLAETLYQSARYACAPVFALKTPPLRSAPEALVRRALRLWFQEGVSLCGLEPEERALSYDDTLALARLSLAAPGATFNLPLELKAVAGAAHLHLMRQSGAPLVSASKTPAVALECTASSYALAGIALCLSPAPSCGELPTDAHSALLTPDILALGPVVRLAEPGDTIHPFGAVGSKPLRRYLTDRKIDPAFRSALPVIAVGKRVLWIPALCASEELRVSAPDSGGCLLRVVGEVPYASHHQKE